MAQLKTRPVDTGTGDYVLERQVGHLLRRAHQRATAIFQENMEEDLTPQQYAALIKIRDFGKVSQNRLGRSVAMDPATAQGVTQRLLAKNLIRREDDPDDRRRSLLSLTANGEVMVERSQKIGARITEQTLAPLTRPERETFLALLSRLT